MENKKRIIIETVVLIGTVLIIAGIFFFAHFIGYTAYANEPSGINAEHKMELVIESGESVMNVAEKLEKEDMIASKYAFWLRSKFSEYDGLMKAGTYEVNETMGNDDILAVITQTATTE